MHKQLFLISMVVFLLIDNSSAQVAGSANILNATGITSVQSGTANSYKLSIGGATKIFGDGNPGASGSATLIIGNSAGSTGSGRVYGIHSSDDGKFLIYDSTGTTPTYRFGITAAGKIGIGTISPNTALDVISNGGSTAYFKNGENNNGSFTQVDIFRPNAGAYSGQGMSIIALGSSYTSSGAFKPDGVFAGANAGASGGLSLVSSHSSGEIRFYTGGIDDANQRMVIKTGGNLGVGVSSPSEKLDVSGNIKFSGALMPNNSAGTAGQVLTSAGAGAAPTWSTAISGWGLTGNNGTSPSTNFLGTTDNTDLLIKTNNAERLKISGAGFATFTSPVSSTVSSIFNVLGGTSALMPLLEMKNNGEFVFRSQSGASLLGYNGSSARIYSGPGTDVDFRQSGSVYGNYFGASKFRGYNWYQTEIAMDNPSITYTSIGAQYVAANSSAHKFTVLVPLSEANTNIASFDNGGSVLVSISKDGKLGIGAAATEKLDVNGNIYTNGKILINQANTTAVAPYALAVNGTAIFTKAVVKLNNTWPDYVFDPAYKPLPLSELETYLVKNRHLPGIPAAPEVEKNGIDLGGNQTLLLQKVEELTLYLIELNKKMETLSKENEELKKTINSNKQ